MDATVSLLIADAIVAEFDSPDDHHAAIVVNAHAVADVAVKATWQQLAAVKADIHAVLGHRRRHLHLRLGWWDDSNCLKCAAWNRLEQFAGPWDRAPGGTAPWGVPD